MAVEIRLGKLSPTMETGTINRWLKKEGESVSAGDAIAEVETDKASMPLEVFEDGTLLKIFAPEGATVKVDDVVAVVGQAGEDISEIASAVGVPANAPRKSTALAETKQTGAQGAPPMVTMAVETAPPQRAERAAPASRVPSAPVTSAPTNGGRVKASPLAKRLAAERGVDLRALQPSGPGGRIVQRDVPTTSAASAPTAAPLAAAGQDVPLSNMRQTIARRLVHSKQTIPHWYCLADINMDRAMQFREDLNANLAEGAPKISVTDVIIKVCAIALARHPEVNASFNQTSIRRYSDVNIAIAIATEDGLYTPVLRNVDRMGLQAISASVKMLAQKAREKKLKAEDFGGAGFSISNLGMYGVDHFFAIVNPPESAILAVGATSARPVVDESGQVVAAKMMSVTLSCDHRVIDGALGARFLGTIKEVLEHPAKLAL
jgi:pyruvate dehydrogenase E2 component (dihydrolipoamide acetyltransferase)